MSGSIRAWTAQEDEALRQLKQDQQMTDWEAIAQILASQYNFGGRTGKQCRRRYKDHASSQVHNGQWTQEDWQQLQQGHNEFGNKWSLLASRLGRSEGSVKNYFHSRMRVAVRRINRWAHAMQGSVRKGIKATVLPKLLQCAEDFFLQADRNRHTQARECFLLKNRILEFVPEREDQLNPESPQFRNKVASLVRDLNHHNKVLRKRPRRSQVNANEPQDSRDLFHDSEQEERQGEQGAIRPEQQDPPQQPVQSGAAEAQMVPQPILYQQVYFGNQPFNWAWISQPTYYPTMEFPPK